MNNANKQAIFLMGPTASGKTALAIALAQQFPIDIISVDSALVYRGMDIGTGKPDVTTLNSTPHALINILDPVEKYSAADFCQDSYRLMQQSITKGRIPLLVGGTMMYYNALQQGLSDLPAADTQVRAQLLQEAEQHDGAWLYAKLQSLDPIAAGKIHPNDPQRILRALEVITITGKTFSSQLIDQQQLLQGWAIKKIALAPTDRKILHHKIEQRFYSMLEQGLVAEVAALMQRQDLHLGLPSMRAVGYRQVWQYLLGLISEPEMIAQSIAATRQLAKRQFTWLRRWQDLLWFDSEMVDLPQHVLDTIKDFVLPSKA